MELTNYLNSNKAVADYATLAFTAGENGNNFQKQWLNKLDADGIITQDVNEADLVPLKIINAIQTAVEDDEVFKWFKPVFNVEAGSIIIEPKNAVGALGHKRLADKTVQQTTMKIRNLVPAAIYKLQRLDHMTFLKGGALVDWLMRELPAYVIERLAQAILIGGVINEDSTPFTAVYPIKGDELTVAGAELPANYTGEQLREALIADMGKVKGNNRVIFISNTANAKLASGDGSLATAVLLGQVTFGAKAFQPTELLDARDGVAEVPYIIVDTNSYMIGFQGSGVETLGQFVIQQNAQYVESRAYVAGSLLQANRALASSVAGA